MPPPPPRRRRRRRHRRRTAAATTAAAHALFRRSHSLTHSLTRAHLRSFDPVGSSSSSRSSSSRNRRRRRRRRRSSTRRARSTSRNGSVCARSTMRSARKAANARLAACLFAASIGLVWRRPSPARSRTRSAACICCARYCALPALIRHTPASTARRLDSPFCSCSTVPARTAAWRTLCRTRALALCAISFTSCWMVLASR